MDLAPFVARALACVHRPYPTGFGRLLASDADLALPRLQTPAFSGCLDWHSAVHNHWLLARALRLRPDAPFAGAARAALARSLTAENLAAEDRFLRANPGFELPYGLAWLVTLARELRGWDDPDARAWSERIAPMEVLAADRVASWTERLSRPIRSGVHDQTAFAMGLVLDSASDPEVALRLRRRAIAFHGDDRDGPIHLEPSGADFLSPCLSVADLMRRVHGAADFAAWFDRFLPGLRLPEPAVAPDSADAMLVHLDGLNLSRAWMLEGIARGLPVDDGRRPILIASAAAHRAVGLPAARTEHYGGSHWLPTFAVYSVSTLAWTPSGGRSS